MDDVACGFIISADIPLRWCRDDSYICFNDDDLERLLMNSQKFIFCSRLILVVFSAIISLALISQHLPETKVFAHQTSMLSTSLLGHLLYTKYLYAFEVTGAVC